MMLSKTTFFGTIEESLIHTTSFVLTIKTSSGTDDGYGGRASGKEKLGNRLDATELFVLLESRESHILEEVKVLVHENLNNSRESWLLCALVEYYIATKSTRCLEILTGIREPHDKHLFDKVLESLKGQNREQALDLLSHVVRKQPSWLHRIVNHKVLPYLLQFLKTDTNIPHLMSGLLTIVTLLPIIPSLVGPHLQDIFEVYARLSAWNTKKSGNVPEVYFLHLHVALYALFNRLYAMYPCNFLAFLRSYYGGRENNRENRENLHIFSDTIKPMLERVRLHPLLVTASKETELLIGRWKNQEPHDIIVQCSKVSLDTLEGMQGEEENVLDDRLHQHSLSATTLNKQGSSASELVSVHLSVEPGSLVGDALEHLTLATTATPLVICDFSPTNDHLQGPSEEDGMNSLVTSMASVTSKADSEIESELHNSKILPDETDGASISTSRGPIEGSRTDSFTRSQGEVVTAEEAKEERSQPPQQGHFLSTTDTLTATVSFAQSEEVQTVANSSLSSSSAQDEEASGQLAPLGGPASDVLIQRLVHGINRLRFFSHCGHPPEIPLDWLRRSPTLRKSHSWPVLKCDSFAVSPREFTHPAGSPASSSLVNRTVGNLDIVGTSQTDDYSWATAATTQTEPELTTVAAPFAPPVVAPVECKQASQESQGAGDPLLAPLKPTPFAYLSPGELLDRYLQLGSQVYMEGLSLTSNKDTDWTHFGGTPPPDEMRILRGEITLLHTQLLFERYRREVHAERNRRLLGKAKKARALEEENAAMKDQLVLQEKGIQELNRKLSQALVKGQPEFSANTCYQDLHDHLRLLKQDNQKLDALRQRLEHTLKQQHNEMAGLRKSLDLTQCQLLESTLELESVRKEASRCGHLETEVKQLNRRLVVLHHLHERHLDKISHLTQPPDQAFQMGQLQDTAKHEIQELNQKLRMQETENKACRMRIETLEQAVASKDLIIEEQKQLLENVKSCHNDILQSKLCRIKSLQSICQRQEEHILELQHKLCIQDSVSKPVPSSSHHTELLSQSCWHWHPAQTEPTRGIQVTEEEPAPHHNSHHGEQTVANVSENNAIDKEPYAI